MQNVSTALYLTSHWLGQMAVGAERVAQARRLLMIWKITEETDIPAFENR